MSAPVIPVAREQPSPDERPLGVPAAVLDPRRLATVGVGFALAAGVLLRFFTSSHLWLDETLTVNIAHSPLTGGTGPDLFDRLRHDGAPPLFYVLLHFWMQVAGTSEIAVRALAGLLSVATLPLAWLAGRRVGRIAAQRYGLGPAVPTAPRWQRCCCSPARPMRSATPARPGCTRWWSSSSCCSACC